MKTEYRLAETLKHMMSSVPLDSISVTTLVKKCHINRQTFYYHFHDIYDLLTLVFLNETIPDIDGCQNTKQMVKCIFAYYSKNFGFVDATINSAGKELLQEFVYNSCYRTIYRFINEIPDSKKIHFNERKAIARYYALAYGYSIVYYLSSYKSKTLDGLMNCFAFTNDAEIKNAVFEAIKKKEKSL